MTTNKSEPHPKQPSLIMDDEARALYDVDPTELAQTLSDVGVHDPSKVTVNVASTPKFYGGSASPKWVDRLVHPNSEGNEGEGHVIRIRTSTRLRPHTREPEALNGLLAHEAKHVAQMENNDISLKLGHATMLGLVVLGMVAGNKLAKHRGVTTRTAATLAGGLSGYKLGYQLAPYERQARAVEKHAKSSKAFTKKS